MPIRLMLFRETVAVYCENHTEHTNTLCGQKSQSISHRKHITSPLQGPAGQCCLEKQWLFIVRTMRNTQIRSVGRKLSPYLTGTIETNQLLLFRETAAVCCENHTEHTNTLCGGVLNFRILCVWYILLEW
jgi:hypothetical protein